MHTEKLFSYGTLRYKSVQLANFGRSLDGCKDSISCYQSKLIEISDPKVIAQSGENRHPALIYTGNEHDIVHGMVFEVSADELQQADSYEVTDYQRVEICLNSGVKAWAYIYSLAS